MALNDIRILQLNAGGLGLNRDLPFPTAPSSLGFNLTTFRPEIWSYGDGITVTGTVISAFSGDYDDLTNKPTIPSVSAVGVSGEFSDLLNVPTTLAGYGITDGVTQDDLDSALAGVGTVTSVSGTGSVSGLTLSGTVTSSGSLTLGGTIAGLPISAVTGLQGALDGKYSQPMGTTSQYVRGDGSLAAFPSIPSGQVNSDWNASSGVAEVLNKPQILSVGVPIARTMALATAYQATNPARPAIFQIMLSATSSFSLSATVPNEGQILIGTTTAVASGTGTVVGRYDNTIGGGLVIGVSITDRQANTYSIVLPAGYYLSIRQTAGSGLSVVSVTEQPL